MTDKMDKAIQNEVNRRKREDDKIRQQMANLRGESIILDESSVDSNNEKGRKIYQHKIVQVISDHLSFHRFITFDLLSFIYGFCVILSLTIILLVGISVLFTSVEIEDLMRVILAATIFVVFIRVVCEFAIIFFRISQTLSETKHEIKSLREQVEEWHRKFDDDY